jgi:hypothetical protein
MTEKLPSKPTMQIREALNNWLRRTDLTAGREVGEMYLGPEIFIARLRRPQVLEGDWSEVDGTVDLLDLIDLHRAGDSAGSAPTSGRERSSSLILPGQE